MGVMGVNALKLRLPRATAKSLAYRVESWCHTYGQPTASRPSRGQAARESRCAAVQFLTPQGHTALHSTRPCQPHAMLARHLSHEFRVSMEKFGCKFSELKDPQDRMSVGGTIGGRMRAVRQEGGEQG